MVPVRDFPQVQTVRRVMRAAGTFAQPRALRVIGGPDEIAPAVAHLEVVRRDTQGDGQPHVVEAVLIGSEGRGSVKDGAVDDYLAPGRCRAAVGAGDGLDDLEVAAVAEDVLAVGLAEAAAVAHPIGHRRGRLRKRLDFNHRFQQLDNLRRNGESGLRSGVDRHGVLHNEGDACWAIAGRDGAYGDVVGTGQLVHVQRHVLNAGCAIAVRPSVVEFACGRSICQGHRQWYAPCGRPHFDVKRTEVRWQFNEDGVDHGSCATNFVDR